MFMAIQEDKLAILKGLHFGMIHTKFHQIGASSLWKILKCEKLTHSTQDMAPDKSGWLNPYQI